MKLPLGTCHKIIMFAALGRRTALLATRRAAQTQQATKRRMGGAAAAPEWTGIDKVVRGYFPQDDQRKLFIFCMCGWVDYIILLLQSRLLYY